ncbi:MAG: FAD-binding oxidoreductase [Frankia sp.]
MDPKPDPAHPDTVWWGWGLADRHHALPASTRNLLTEVFGVSGEPRPPVALGDVRLPPSAPPAAARAALVDVVGAEFVRDDAVARVAHCRGRSTPDLLRVRAGDASDAPDLVVSPADHDEVQALLVVCAAHRLAAVPFGGGTSVVGGLAPERAGFAGVVAIDLARLDRLLAVDLTSATATFEPGVRGPRAEHLLAEHGLTLGHVPQSFEHASIGGFAATRSSGQASAGYGRFDAMVVALRVATPTGTWELGRAPASAAGPDLRQLVLGSEGAFGVITSVTVRVHHRPAVTVYEAWRAPDFLTGAAALRRLAQEGPLPTVARVSDETETAVGLATAQPADPAGGSDSAPGRDRESGPREGGEPGGGCLLVTAYAGSTRDVDYRRAEVTRVLLAAGLTPLSPAAGDAWVRGRFEGPYLRDALLDVGVVAETLETAGFWSTLPALYQGVRDAVTSALAGGGTVVPLVMAHVSHVYPTGASLYFTVVYPAGSDPVGAWRAAKSAASDAIVAAGGTITHHHAVGTDHRPWLGAEVGPIGLAVLRAVKDTIDPGGILNPGVLIPAGTAPE